MAQIFTVEVGMGMSDCKLPHQCGCGRRWTGFKTAHCTGCHETFTTVANFDRHRAGPHSDVNPRYCRPPQDVGLVDAGRVYPCWMQPGVDRDYNSDLSD